MTNGHALSTVKASQMADIHGIQPCFLGLVPAHIWKAGSANLRRATVQVGEPM